MKKIKFTPLILSILVSNSVLADEKINTHAELKVAEKQTQNLSASQLEAAITSRDIDTIKLNSDLISVNKSQVATMAYSSGRLKLVYDRITSSNGILDNRGRLMLQAIDSMKASLNMIMNKYTSETFDIDANYTNSLTVFKAEPNCTLDKEVVKEAITLNYACGINSQAEYTFRLESDGSDNYYVTGMRDYKLNRLIKKIVEMGASFGL